MFALQVKISLNSLKITNSLSIIFISKFIKHYFNSGLNHQLCCIWFFSSMRLLISRFTFNSIISKNCIYC